DQPRYIETQVSVHQVFTDFAAQIYPDSALITFADDEGAAALAQRHRDAHTVQTPRVTVYTYGLATNMNTQGDTTTNGRPLDLAITTLQPDSTVTDQQVTYRFSVGTHQAVQLPTPRIHNALNAAGVLLAAVLADIPASVAAQGLASFSGSARRFEHHGTVNDIRVYDDYAHHPTEVEAAISAANIMAAGNRVHVIFQPHLYSRTR